MVKINLNPLYVLVAQKLQFSSLYGHTENLKTMHVVLKTTYLGHNKCTER